MRYGTSYVPLQLSNALKTKAWAYTQDLLSTCGVKPVHDNTGCGEHLNSNMAPGAGRNGGNTKKSSSSESIGNCRTTGSTAQQCPSYASIVEGNQICRMQRRVQIVQWGDVSWVCVPLCTPGQLQHEPGILNEARAHVKRWLWVFTWVPSRWVLEGTSKASYNLTHPVNYVHLEIYKID